MDRVFLIVLDSFGIGAEPDCEMFGDAETVNTLKSVSGSDALDVPNMTALGLYNIDETGERKAAENPKGSFARMREASMAKDTTVGHWEIAGLISHKPRPTYPDGFPDEVIEEFSRLTGREVICNKPYSGTQVIKDYGQEQIRTGALIVYTSADSVFQVAAHEKYIGLDELYRCCEIARNLLQGEHGVGRVIARPYAGEYPDFIRTANRHDYSLTPPGNTALRALASAGMDCIGIGKISDIFAGDGITHSYKTYGNIDGMKRLLDVVQMDFKGICFANLVDFDMLYGHRRNVQGYAAALSEFDAWLPCFIEQMRENDALIITADHGCDPCAAGTDHTREYVPMLIYSQSLLGGVNLHTRESFADIGATVLELLGVKSEIDGRSFAPLLYKDGQK